MRTGITFYLLVPAIVVIGGSWASAKEAYEPTWESLSKRNPAPQWFRDDKFNADEWAELFKKAGARFAGPVAEHHDGFAVWRSGVTPWNAATMGPKRDITGELEKAVRKRGMRFVTTFHHARNSLWQKNGNWTGHYEFVKKDFPLLLDDPKQAVLYGYLPREVAVDDYEKGRADRLTDYVWLTDDTISRGSWCYTQDLQIKSTREVLHVLIDIVSKNGQLLLNISPKADGTIPEDQRKVLLGVGAWLGKFGEVIYGTRPWLTYGEGPTQMEKGGHFVRMKGEYGPQDIRYTRKGSTIYAISLGWPGENAQVVLTSFVADRLEGDLRVTGVSMLDSGRKIKYEQREDGLVLTTAGEKPADMAVVFRIETTGSAEFVPLQATVTLLAEKAVLEGDRITLETRIGGRQSIGFWDNPREKAHWLAKVPDAGTYVARGEFAAVAPSRVTFEAGDRSVTGDIPATGGRDKTRMVELGRIEFDKPGVYHVTLRASDPASWKAVNLWQIHAVARQMIDYCERPDRYVPSGQSILESEILLC